MKPRNIVHKVLEDGEAERIPLHIETDDKALEAKLGDIVGVRARIVTWDNFYDRGGPLRRRPHEKLMEWIDRIEEISFSWDISSEINHAIETFIDKVKSFARDHFILFKVLGPTETSEAFFAPSVPARLKRLGQIVHHFNFAMLVRIKPSLALRIYDNIAKNIMNLIKAGAELDIVDAVRIADDIAGYQGPFYPYILIQRYIEWHKHFTHEINKNGKWALLHSDGDLRRGGLLENLVKLYQGFHPLDLVPKSTLQDAEVWVKEIYKLREKIGDRSPVFFTGLPVDLIFNDDINVMEFAKIIRKLLDLHGRRWLILATTHAPYPGRSYKEKKAREKIEIIRILARAKYSL